MQEAAPAYRGFEIERHDMEREIIGYEEDCNCDHCGRKLRVGIVLSGYGTIGADCLNAAIVFDRKRWGAGKPGAPYLRELAIKRQKNSPERLSQMGMARAFRLALVAGALEMS